MKFDENTLYKTMYLFLFNEVTEALRLIDKGEVKKARKLLIEVQQDCEELYMQSQE